MVCKVDKSKTIVVTDTNQLNYNLTSFFKGKHFLKFKIDPSDIMHKQIQIIDRSTIIID
jgi:hypothetical protein